MKIIVLIRRQANNESEPGTLRAWAVQQCGTVEVRGSNLLLGHQFTDVDTAMNLCRARIRECWKLGRCPEIEFHFEGGCEAPQADETAWVNARQGG